jgi:tetratricopeptide (TPR) repeat protein
MDPVKAVIDRLKNESRDSDAAYCDSLLKSGEFAIKHTTAVLLAAISDTEEGKKLRYRYVYRLLRADGLGDWSRVLGELLVGPTLAMLNSRFGRTPHGEALTRLVKRLDARIDEDSWALEAVTSIRSALEFLGEEHVASKNRSHAARFLEFVHQFPLLRNKMDAHGAPTANQKGEMATRLRDGISAVLHNLPTLQLPIVYLQAPRASSSNRMKALDVVGDSSEEVTLKINERADKPYQEGLHLVIKHEDNLELEPIELLRVDSELRDCFYANGAFNDDRQISEFLAYGSAKRKKFDVRGWSATPIGLPASLTAGRRNFSLDSNGTIHNLPDRETGYISRSSLESEIREQLTARNRHILTLKGMGGVGKTSLALETAWQVSQNRMFDVVVWASARDLDLGEGSSRIVRPEVTTFEDLALLNRQLFAQIGNVGDEPAVEWFKSCLASDSNGSVLWILDNFETMHDPVGVFRQIDSCLGSENRVLITTRHRDYQGDYQIPVAGMEKEEFERLVAECCIRNNLRLNSKRIEQLYIDCDGHPYIAVIYLAELRDNPQANISRVLSHEDVLRDLLERTYSRLNDDSRRLFMLLCSFKSVVSLLAVRLAYSLSTSATQDVGESLKFLGDSSLIKVRVATDGEQYVEVPPTARIFGHQKYSSSDEQLLIKEMSEVLQLFGVTTMDHLTRADHSSALTRRLESFWNHVQDEPNLENRVKYLDLVKLAARTHPSLWNNLAMYYKNSGDLRSAISSWRSLIESGNDDPDTWRRLYLLYRDTGEKHNMHHASVQGLVRFPEHYFAQEKLVVTIATQINTYVRDNRELSALERYSLVQPVVDTMENNLGACSANALGALASLHRKLKNDKRARDVAKLGLDIDPDDEYCRRFLNMS